VGERTNTPFSRHFISGFPQHQKTTVNKNSLLHPKGTQLSGRSVMQLGDFSYPSACASLKLAQTNVILIKAVAFLAPYLIHRYKRWSLYQDTLNLSMAE
jgi:hypothetical protein